MKKYSDISLYNLSTTYKFFLTGFLFCLFYLDLSAQITDSLVKDSLNLKVVKKQKVDSLSLPISSSGLNQQVDYKANDSIIYLFKEKKILLFGKAYVKYGDVEMNAAFIKVDYQKNVMTAIGRIDSNGKYVEYPDFKEKDQTFKADSIQYNFKTKKGRVQNLKTKQGDGNVIVERGKYFKVDSSNVIYAQDAKYTTCDAEVPHYYIQATKMKLIPADKVISGPAVLHIERVPLPLVLPFGFFPASSKRSSGLIFPQYGEDKYLGGFYLKELGYYFGNSDYYDVRLTSDLYTTGSYALKATTQYAYRYHFGGGFSIAYSRIKFGLEDTKERSIQNQYGITWNHQIDAKANPGTNFSANVNINSSKYNRVNERDINKRLNSSLNSSVSYSKQFGTTPFSMSANFRHSQDQSGRVLMDLPDVTLNMSRINPFQNFGKQGGSKWYQTIGLSYNAQGKNSISITDSTLFKQSAYNNNTFQKGLVQNAGLSSTFKIFKYISLSPQINYTGFMYFDRYDFNYNESKKKVDTLTERSVFYAQRYSFSAILGTTIYGTYIIKSKKLLGIRHLITPNLSYNYSPDFRKSNGSFRYIKKDSTESQAYFSRYAKGIFGGPGGSGVTNGLGFSLGNSLEMKLRVKQGDTSFKTKKIPLLTALNFSTFYNFAADSYKLSNVSVYLANNISSSTTLSGSLNFDPYGYIGKRRINKFALSENRKLGMFTNGQFTLATSLVPSAENKKKSSDDPRLRNSYPGTYTDNDFKFNASIGYSLFFQKTFRNDIQRFKDTISAHTLNLRSSLQMTKTWKLTVDLNYDLKKFNISTSNIQLYKDLHCWEMSFNWVPFGAYQSYYFQINIKSQMLRDLKYDRRKSFNAY